MKGGIGLRRQLNTFDVTNLVVGSIIGADIYVAAALGAKLVGPASLLVWMLAGLMAIVIALAFSYSATILPRVGGPYSYVRDVAGPFSGFIIGWALFLAEWLSLAVFPVAFTRYFVSLVPALVPYQILLKGLFVSIILTTNVLGVKAAGRFNDALTIGKLTPLLLLMALGTLIIGLHPAETLSNFHPFITGGLSNLGQALVLIFWAYAGFELSTLPADEIQAPKKTIPRAIVVGMLIVIVFYMATNFAIIGLVDQATLSASTTPLIDAAMRIFSASPALALFGILLMGVGALVSIMGADESGTIGTSRLAYALSIDGLMPRSFSRLHPRFKTPYLGLIVICSTAFVASVVETLTDLINASVFLLSFVYLATCAATMLLERKYGSAARGLRGQRAIPVLGMMFSLTLMTQVNMQQIFVSLILLVIGIPLYVFFTPKKELSELKSEYLSNEAVLGRAYEQGERFLAHLIRHIKRRVYRRTGTQPAWVYDEK